MEETRFDAMTRGLANPRTRRQALSGLVGVAALVGGSVVGLGVAEAKRGGNGKGKSKGRKNGNGNGNGNGGNGGGNGHGKGKGRKKIAFCHKADDEGFVFIRVGEPARKAHLKHGDTECEVDECTALTGECSAEGECLTTAANEGESCGDNGEGTCVAGECVVG